jgi:hypothetical protein
MRAVLAPPVDVLEELDVADALVALVPALVPAGVSVITATPLAVKTARASIRRGSPEGTRLA